MDCTINFTVTVGNCGTVYSGEDRAEAEQVFGDYVQICGTHKASRLYEEDVTLMADGEILDEYLNGGLTE